MKKYMLIRAVAMGLIFFVACDKEVLETKIVSIEDITPTDNNQDPGDNDDPGNNDNPGDEDIAISLVNTQASNVGTTSATLSCRIVKSNEQNLTQAELTTLMSKNPTAGFCLVEGTGTPTKNNTTINCTQSAKQGNGSMSGTFSNLKAGTQYTVRAWFTKINGSTTYGSNSTFTTTQASINIEMVTVQGGTFTMGATSEQGSDYDSDERPTHSVTLSSYQIGKYEVTHKLWKEVMGTNPSYFTGDDNRPVENVSWNDVQEFITKLNAKTGKNYRLPTEAEWEFAARGGKQSQGYKYSGSNTIGNVAWYWDNANETTHPVGQKSPNELGIYDMSGNVWEWCGDYYGNYSKGSQTNPRGPLLRRCHVLRGGSWVNRADFCRVSYRGRSVSDNNRGYIGFRLVLPLN